MKLSILLFIFLEENHSTFHLSSALQNPCAASAVGRFRNPLSKHQQPLMMPAEEKNMPGNGSTQYHNMQQLGINFHIVIAWDTLFSFYTAHNKEKGTIRPKHQQLDREVPTNEKGKKRKLDRED